jgi:DNA modification methylase
MFPVVFSDSESAMNDKPAAKKPTKKQIISARIEEARATLAAGHFSRFGQLDNTDALDGMRGLPDDCIAALITDPPYGVDMAEWDGEVPGVIIWEEALRVMVPGAYAVVAAAPRTYHQTAAAMEKAGFVIKDQLVWRYTQSFPGSSNLGGEWRSGLKTNQEPWVVAQKPLEKGLNLRENWEIHYVGGVRVGEVGAGNWKTNVIECGKPNDAERDFGITPGKAYELPESLERGGWKNSKKLVNRHPTVKPLGLMRAIVRRFTPENSLLMDPFMGSGSTLIAAAAEGHSLIGFDLNYGYWDLASDRINHALEFPEQVPAAV